VAQIVAVILVPRAAGEQEFLARDRIIDKAYFGRPLDRFDQEAAILIVGRRLYLRAS
jgi:hypothetical protein